MGIWGRNIDVPSVRGGLNMEVLIECRGEEGFGVRSMRSDMVQSEIWRRESTVRMEGNCREWTDQSRDLG